MPSKSIGSLYAELSLRDGKFVAGLKSARHALNKFGTIAGAAAAGGAVALGAGLAAGTVHTLGQVDALNDLSSQTGIAVDDMMKLQLAYKDGGREAEMAGKDIGKMQKALVAAHSGGLNPFKSIGLSVEDLMKMNPAKQFETIGAAIMRIQNPAERTAKAMEIFGKGGMGLTTVFGGLPDAEKALGRMPELAKKFGQAMGDANDLLGHLPLKSDQFFMGFTAGIIGELLPNLKKIDTFDFTTIGQNLGIALATGFEGIKDGTVFEIFALKGMAIMTQFAAEMGQALLSGINAALDAGTKKFENFSTFAGDSLVGMSSDQGVKDRWQDIKNQKIAQRASDQGFSPLGGGAPDDGKSFADRFNDYQKNGDLDLLQGTIEHMNEAADTLGKELARRMQNASDSAAALGDKQSATNPLLDIYKPPISEAKQSVNEYQRRGLSLDGGMGGDPKADKQISLLTEMRDALKRMATKGGQQLVWP